MYVELGHPNAPALINKFSIPIIKKPKVERTYLLIPYDEREFAKSLGAIFDGDCKKDGQTITSVGIGIAIYPLETILDLSLEDLNYFAIYES